MKAAHIPLGIVGGHGGNHGADEHLTQPCGKRKKYRSHKKPCKSILWEKVGDKGIDHKAYSSKRGHQTHHGFKRQFSCKKGEKQVHSQLHTKARQHQGAKEGVGNAVHFPKRDKQHRRHGKRRG